LDKSLLRSFLAFPKTQVYKMSKAETKAQAAKPVFMSSKGQPTPIWRYKPGEDEEKALKRASDLQYTLPKEWHVSDKNDALHSGPRDGCKYCPKVEEIKGEKADTLKIEADVEKSGDEVKPVEVVEEEVPVRKDGKPDRRFKRKKNK
jgi:hypothetical protein